LVYRVRLSLLTIVLVIGVIVSHVPFAAAEMSPKVTSASGKVGLNQTISVEVEKLSEWTTTPGNNYSKLVLYLNGRPFKELNARAIDLPGNSLQFEIRRTNESRDAWATLLGKPDAFVRALSVSIGPENGPAFATEIEGTKKLNFIIVDRVWFGIFMVLLVSTLLLFVWLVRASNILRDSGPELPVGQRRTYSLARSQMAFWFFLVIVSYVLIWLIMDDRDSITPTVLGLMGISAATALGAAVIDANKPAGAGLALDATPASRGFFLDLLSDSGGISLHRFQMLIFTLVLGIIFIASVFNNRAMPEFSGTLLGLMGISAGTYVGFKFPEPK
jgi:hypothetical protein